MIGQQILILLIAIVCFTLAHGATKLEKKENKPIKLKQASKKLTRQGLDDSVESDDPQDEGLQETAPKSPLTNGGDQKLEFNVNNDHNSQYHNQDEHHQANLAHINQMEKEYEENDEDGFFLDIESGEYDSKEMIMLQGKGTRGLEAGDIFTAQEMLPIAVNLMKRAKSNGKGRGIVSSETNPKSLADNLFEKYFWKNCEIHLLNGETVVSHADDWCNLVETTDENEVFRMKRIAILKDEDISGLDALQALALSGTVSTQRSTDKYIGPETDIEGRGNTEFPDSTEVTPRRKSLYRLLTKPFFNKIRRVSRRGNYQTADQMKSKMAKKRRLVVNPNHRRLAKKIKNRKGRGGQHKLKKLGRQGLKPREKKGITPNIIKKNGGSKTKRFCRWKYGCENQEVLETCKLSMDCSEAARSKDYLGIKLLPHEKRENLSMLRNLAGVDVIDTEVEKILENRYSQLINSKLGNIQRSESVADYFNNLINFQKHEHDNNAIGPTPPMDSYEDSTDTPDAQQNPDTQENTRLSNEDSETEDIVKLQAAGDIMEAAKDPEINEEAAEPTEVAAEAGEEMIEAVQIQEVSAKEVPETEIENRRKFLSDHKATSKKLKSI